MRKVILEFTVPDDDYSLANALEGDSMASAIDEVLERIIRPAIKYGSPSKETREILERIKTELIESRKGGVV